MESQVVGIGGVEVTFNVKVVLPVMLTLACPYGKTPKQGGDPTRTIRWYFHKLTHFHHQKHVFYIVGGKTKSLSVVTTYLGEDNTLKLHIFVTSACMHFAKKYRLTFMLRRTFDKMWMWYLYAFLLLRQCKGYLSADSVLLNRAIPWDHASVLYE